MGASATAISRGMFPQRCGIGGRWHEQPSPGLRRLRRWHDAGTPGAPIFRSRKFTGAFFIRGVTRDATGAALGGCVVKLFNAWTDAEVGDTVSDGAGVFEFRTADNTTAHYIVAYLAGAPDRAATSLSGLTASAEG